MRRLRWVVFAVAAILCGLVFTYSEAAGNQPLAVSPGSGAGTLIAGACPTFSWGAVPGAESYQLVTYSVPGGLASSASPGDLKELWRVTLPGSARAWTVPAAKCLAHGGSYAWAVRAVVGGQPGPWSEANLFSVEEAPSAEEVRGTIAGLRRYLATLETRPGSRASTGEKNPGASARSQLRPGEKASGKKLGTQEKARSRRRMALRGLSLRKTNLHALTGRGAGSSLRSVSRASATPTLGTPSLSVDANVALGASSNVFKDGRVFLWNDAVGNIGLGDSALSSLQGFARYNTAVGAGDLASTHGSSAPSLDGWANTAIGYNALFSNTTGVWNTATGEWALKNNTSGLGNTATGQGALYANSTGSGSTALGAYALFHNTSGSRNTATGYFALASDSSGSHNTATGYRALENNSYGSSNTAMGYAALVGKQGETADFNTAVGSRALFNNTTGHQNTAVGSLALFVNTTGYYNTAEGYKALYSNDSGIFNTAIGQNTLGSNTTGNRNIGIGWDGGLNNTTGNDSIFIGNTGLPTDAKTIKIGIEGTQASTFIAGIHGETTGQPGAETVVIDSNGQLGTVSSSRRFKEQIEDMGESTDRLYELRPVTFRYKKYVKEAIERGQDPSKLARSYGLIAEEVAKVFPELVVYGKDGRPQAVEYRLLAPMLLNELQKEHWTIVEQASELGQERARNEAQEADLERQSRLLGEQENELAAEEKREAGLEARLQSRGRRLAAVERVLARLTSSRGLRGASSARPTAVAHEGPASPACDKLRP